MSKVHLPLAGLHFLSDVQKTFLMVFLAFECFAQQPKYSFNVSFSM